MAALSDHQGPDQLLEILTSGVKLLFRMQEAEERLQDQLIGGDLKGAAGLEDERRALRDEAAALDERRRAFLPPGMSLHRYIATQVEPSRRGECLAGLQELEAGVQKLAALHAVNRTLLEERVRYARELREVCIAEKDRYDQKGRLKKRPDKVPRNLDRNC